MRIAYVLGGLAATAVLLAGCGGGGAGVDGAAGEPAAATTRAPPEKPPRVPCPSSSERVRVTLDGHVGAENAGILMADHRGYFGDAGLHVWVGTPGNPELPASYVAAGADDVGVTQQPQAVLTREMGEPIVAIGSVISEPTAAMIWLRGSGIDGVADLEGRVIAAPGVPFQQGFLEQALAKGGLTVGDVKVLPAGYKLAPTLLRGEVDAIFGGSANIEGKALEARGAEPVVTPVRKLGIPAYDELVVIARSKCVAQHPAMYRRFMAAVRRGTKAAAGNPGGAARLIEESIEADPEVSREQTEAQVEATLPLLSESGYMDPAQASNLVAWMHDVGMIKREKPVEHLFTNDYLRP
jgi:putative hydroxymethylpyrimidine transport system substrate-binding protein